MKQSTYTIDGRPLTLHYLDLPGVQDIINEVVLYDCYALKELNLEGVKLKTVVDVGAHMGFFSAMVHHYWPEATVISIEPDVDLLPCLKANAKVNLCCPVAIRYDGNTRYYVSPHTGGSLIYDSSVNFSRDIPKVYQARKVEVKPLEVVDDWIHGAPIDFLKLDCEGSEFHILSSLNDAMIQRITRMAGEYHHITGYRFIEQILNIRFPHLGHSCGQHEESRTVGMFFAAPRNGLDKSAAEE